MAGLGGKNWTFEEEVTSSDVNGFLADQVVMRFADATARTAGFGGAGEPTLAEGMVSYLDDANRVDYYNGSAWKPVSAVLQVVSTTKTDTFSTASTTFTDVTGLSASITPSATSSKVLIYATLNTGASGNIYVDFRFMRDSTAIGIADTASNRPRTSFSVEMGGTTQMFGTSGMFLDSPSTTSATTYKIQMFVNAGTGYLNRTGVDRDTTLYDPRAVSTITVMEIAG